VKPTSTRVALTRGDDRIENISRALSLIADEINFQGCQRVLVKPNLVSTKHQLAATHVDALRAVMAFVRNRYDGQLVIAEGAALEPTREGFERFGYTALEREFDAALVDLNADQTVGFQVYDRRLKKRTLHLAQTVVESDYRISVCPPKTHDPVQVTLSLKNMIMGSLVNRSVAGQTETGCPVGTGRVPRSVTQKLQIPHWITERLHLADNSDKAAMHQGYAVINLNLAILALWVFPHLAVIDGFQAMEGRGPILGDPVDWRVAVAGTDALAVDSLTASLMGFDPAQVGYLAYCRRLGLGNGDPGSIKVVGGIAPEDVRRVFRPHPAIRKQRAWRLDNIERWLQPAQRVSD
jgi:uncharacterized protein (DUF362 family)